MQLTVFNRDPVTHTIPLEFLDADLEVGIPDSDDILVGDFLELYVRGTPLGTRRTVTVADKQAAQGNPAFYYSMTIDKASFPSEGESVTFNVDYYVGSGSVKDLSNLPVEVILDREPPGGTPLPYLSFTPEQLDGIAQSDLTDDYLEVRAPLWYGKRIGDVLTPWLGTSETEGVLITESEVEVTSISETTFARFPKSLLLINGDVPQYFAYQLHAGVTNQKNVLRKAVADRSITAWASLLPPYSPHSKCQTRSFRTALFLLRYWGRIFQFASRTKFPSFRRAPSFSCTGWPKTEQRRN
ncbi:hypothetical protein AO263_20400 [Pseudomonas sp. NZIPFR-PS5]|nr:hypothetical protein AO263_20400 [Pseudomonas sp. NZIPFR-PS5]